MSMNTFRHWDSEKVLSFPSSEENRKQHTNLWQRCGSTEDAF